MKPENTAAFRVAIAHLRIVRLRDGAFRWALSQSLQTPDRFRESFRVGSWGEHLRQHARATVDDRKIEEAVFALHAGAQPPRTVHYLLQDVSVQPLADEPPTSQRHQRTLATTKFFSSEW